MTPIFIIALPLALILIGIVWNSIQIADDQPEYSLEPEPADKLAAERLANYHYFQLQRARILKRQKRIGQYSWMVLAVVITSSWLLYSDTVKTTVTSKQISAIQTLPLSGSKEALLALTLNDGSKSQYLVKVTELWSPMSTVADPDAMEATQHSQLALLGTAINDGNAVLPAGIALRIAN